MTNKNMILGLLWALLIAVGLVGHMTQPPLTQRAYAQSSTEVSDLGSVWNLTAPGSGLIFTTNKRPLATTSAFRIDVCLTAGSVFQVIETDGTTTFTNDLNSGTALTAASVYTFVHESRKTTPAGVALQYNFKVAPGTVVRSLRVTEVLNGAM